MRIAILYFGRSKHFDLTYPSLEKSIGTQHRIDVFYSCDNDPVESIDKFVDMCKPVSVINDTISSYVDFSQYPIMNPEIHRPNYTNMARHFINKKRVFTIFEEYIHTSGIVYDLVISARLDIHLDTLSILTPAPNTIYIPEGHDYFGINDRFAMGNVDVMKKYMMIYDSAVHILESKLSDPHPESLTLANIKYQLLVIERITLNTQILK
jgi:hypothetical protein